jgi:phosphatidylglycerophosphate synthase
MLDATLRPVKDKVLSPLARTPMGRLHPIAISAVGLAFTLGAAVAASQRLVWVAVTLWLLGRVADGVDGLAARATGRASDVGGLLDFVIDTIGYASVPLGLAVGIDTRTGWVVTALLLASFYVNAVSLGHVAALLEKRGRGAEQRGEPTSATMPRGLVEGTETIVFFSLALTFVDAAPVIWSVMAALVMITALERVRWAAGELS